MSFFHFKSDNLVCKSAVEKANMHVRTNFVEYNKAVTLYGSITRTRQSDLLGG